MNKKKSVIEDLFKSAFENHKKNNLEEAEKLYKDVIKQKPDHINSLFYLAGLLAQKKIFNEAKELFEKVIKLNPITEISVKNFGDFLTKTSHCSRPSPLRYVTPLITLRCLNRSSIKM